MAADPDHGDRSRLAGRAADQALAVLDGPSSSYMAGFQGRWAIATVTVLEWARRSELGLACHRPVSEPTADGQITTRWWEYHGEMGN
jgi:hypothetical protein